MLYNIFSNILLMTILGSAVFIFALFTGNLFKEKTKYKTQYILLCCVSAFFLVPFNFIFDFLQSAFSPATINFSQSDITESTVFSESTATGSLIPYKTAFILQAVAIIWILGIIIVSEIKIFKFVKLKRFISENSYPCKDEFIIECVNDEKNSLNIKKDIPIYYCKNVNTPFVSGFLKNKIYFSLYSENCSKEQLRLQIKHELLHCKNNDMIQRFFILLVNIIHWFNPLAYFYVSKAILFGELSCDEQVLADCCFDKRKEYGFLLIDTAESKFKPKLSTNLSQSGKQLKYRLGKIISFSPIKKEKKIVPFAVCFAFMIFALKTGSYIEAWAEPYFDSVETALSASIDSEGTESFIDGTDYFENSSGEATSAEAVSSTATSSQKTDSNTADTTTETSTSSNNTSSKNSKAKTSSKTSGTASKSSNSSLYVNVSRIDYNSMAKSESTEKAESHAEARPRDELSKSLHSQSSSNYIVIFPQ